MPDSNMLPLGRSIDGPECPAALPSATVTVETGDGWIVVSKHLRNRPVAPPYAFDYSYNHYDELKDAEEYFNEIERGEYQGWQVVTIVPCLRGVPLGAKKVI